MTAVGARSPVDAEPTVVVGGTGRHRGEDVDWRPRHRCSVQRHVEEGWVASARIREGVLVLTSGRSDPDVLRAALTEEFGEPVVLRSASEADVRQRIAYELEEEVADLAAHGLARTNPALSARTVLSRGQRVGGAVALLLFAVCLVLAPGSTVAVATAVLSLGFLAGILFKFWVSMVGARFDLVEQVSAEDVAALDDAALPTYTVLVPVFREANIVHDLVRNLEVLDWPKDRLEVLVLVEAEDHETREAVIDAARRTGCASSSSRRGHPRRSRAPATSASPSRRGSTSSSTTPRTVPTPTSSRRCS